MKQHLQNARSDALELIDVPALAVGHGQILVRNAFSLLSPGTENMATDFARKSMLGKLGSRPDLAKQDMRKASRRRNASIRSEWGRRPGRFLRDPVGIQDQFSDA